MKRLTILCAFTLSLSLLSGYMVTPPSDEELQRDWADPIEEAAEDWAQDWEAALDEAAEAWGGQDEKGVERDHYWKVLDSEGSEVGTVTDPEQVKAIDALLSDDGHQGDRLTEDPGDPAYSYVYCQRETLKAGQKAEDRKYEELVRFTVSASEDVVTLRILEGLEELSLLPGVSMEEILTFSLSVPAETAAALRDPAQFTEEK